MICLGALTGLARRRWMNLYTRRPLNACLNEPLGVPFDLTPRSQGDLPFAWCWTECDPSSEALPMHPAKVSSPLWTN